MKVCSFRNVFDEWGLELRGGFGDGESFMGESLSAVHYFSGIWVVINTEVQMTKII